MDLLDLWRVHDEITFFLLHTLPAEAFEATTLLKNGQPSRARNVSQVFAHMHNLRRTRVAPEFRKGIPKFEYADTPDREELLAAFRASGEGFARTLQAAPDLRSLGLLLAHDSHHRALILLACKQSGARLPEQTKFDIWKHWLEPTLTTPD